MAKIDVYDFDGTIYQGDSTIHFFLFCLTKQKSLLKYLPKIIIYTILYLLHLIKVTKYKEKFFCFLKGIKDLDTMVGAFWKTHEKKINTFFKDQVKKKDRPIIYVISASPEFLLKPYFNQFSQVVLIGTIISSKGIIEGENCRGVEKRKRLEQRLGKKHYQIHEFYSDSSHDRPLAELAEEAYLVTGTKVQPWDETILKKRTIKRNGFLLWLAFFSLYLVLGICLSYHYDFKSNFDLLFDSDTARVITDMSSIFEEHYRITVHPLFVLLVQPFILLLSGLTLDKMLAIIIFSSVISSFSVFILYQFSSLYINNEKIKLFLSACFGLAFSNLVFTAGIELYNIAALFLILVWYEVGRILKKPKATKIDIIFLILLALATLSFTITNYVVFLIASFILLLSKKVNFKKLVFINISAVVLLFTFSAFQNLVWHNTPTMHQNFFSSSGEEGNYIQKSLTTEQIDNVIKNDYIFSLLAPKMELDRRPVNVMTRFSSVPIWVYLVSMLFYLVVIFLCKNWKKQKLLNIGLLLTLLFNSCFHLFYGNGSSFLYSCHFVYIPFVLFLINYKEEKNSRWLCYFLGIFMLVLCLNNGYRFWQLLGLASAVLAPNYFRASFSSPILLLLIGFMLLFSYLLLGLFLACLKKFRQKNKEEKVIYGIGATACFLLFHSIFFVIQTTPASEKILWRRVGSSALSNIKTKPIEESLESHFSKEYQSYQQYVKEYRAFVKKYDATLIHDLNKPNFYFFGLGNRRKLVFLENKVIDIETKEILKEWEVEDYCIIPNLYTVIIKTNNNNKYLKLVETETGVVLEEEGKKDYIEGTKIKLSLETFKGQKYQQIKKVLYSEILFNIKASKPYPNILVYNESWYRDAAMAMMVLRQTDNTDLLEAWFDKIENVYDYQNKGEEEPDNLGQLLYLLSQSSHDRTSLINKVLKEAEQIAKENPDGYYLTGNTDFSPHPMYQDQWYQFGMKALGKKTKLSYTGPIDNYSSLSWWSPSHSLGDYVGSAGTRDYPYLSWAQYHAIKKGSLFVNKELYPLSWEKNGSEADYEKMDFLGEPYVTTKVSPTHMWTAAEMLLFILDETGDLTDLY